MAYSTFFGDGLYHRQLLSESPPSTVLSQRAQFGFDRFYQVLLFRPSRSVLLISDLEAFSGPLPPFF